MPAAPVLKAVLFDLDGTIRINLPAAGEVFDGYVVTSGHALSADDRRRAARWEHYYFAGSPEIKADRTASEAESDFWLNFCRRRLTALGLGVARAQDLAPSVSEHMREEYKPEPVVPAGLHALLLDLRRAGLALGVVSNRQAAFTAELQALGLLPLVDFSLAGGEVGAFKPDPEILLRAVDRAGAQPSESMYVGDNYFADVIGARRAGLLPVLYDPQSVFPEADCPVIREFSELWDAVAPDRRGGRSWRAA